MSCQRTGKIKNRKDENLAAFRLRYVFPTPKPYSFQDVFSHSLCQFQGFFPGGSGVKNHLLVYEMQEAWVWSLGQEDPLKEEMATPSSILAWEILWTEEPDRIQSMGPWTVRVRRVWATKYNTTWTNVYCHCVCMLSYVQVFATLWTIACQFPLSMGFLLARILE